MPDGPPTTALPQPYRDPEVSIDIGRLLALTASNRVKCFAVGAVTFLIVLVICATRVPQSFTSQVSLSFPQSAQPTALNLLTGTGSTASRYVGVLKSRKFAETAAKRADAQRLCGFGKFEDAVEAVQTGVSVTDNAKDNLLYLSVTLAGPPRFSADADTKRQRVKMAAARVANAYTQILRSYIATSDTDRDSVLLRAANEQLRTAKQQYDSAAGQLSRFVLRNSGVAAMPGQQGIEGGVAENQGNQTTQDSSAAPLDGTAPRPSTPTMAARELETLYIERGRLAADIQAAVEAIRSSTNLRQTQIGNLGSLPSEDPLLAAARMDVTAAQTALNSLSLQFGPDHPEVRKAEERLTNARNVLHKQTKGILQRGTTADVEANVALRSLLARQDKVNQLIDSAESRGRKGVAFSQAFEVKKNEMWLRLEVLRATASQAAVLSLQTLSLKNRMAVVDSAIPAKTGSPGLLVFALLSSIAATLVVFAYVLLLSARLPVAYPRDFPSDGLAEIVPRRESNWQDPAKAGLVGASDELND